MKPVFLIPAVTSIGAAMAIASAAVAQNAGPQSQWAYYEPENAPIQAGLQSANGGQLILKCDERGQGKVFAVIVSPTRLRPPTREPQVRSLWLRFDEGPRDEVRWRYGDQTAMALNTRRDNTLVNFLNEMADANQLEVRLDATDGAPVEVNFTVAGARDAIDRVFESCGDTNFVD